jgi:large subunit ribosomal protein L9
MKVILLKDVKNVGKKDEVKEVADGYGRNYLIKNKLAVLASDKALEVLGQQKQQYQQEQAEKKAEALKLKEQIEKITLTFSLKAGKDGKLFGSVSTMKICEELAKNHKIELDKRKFIDNDNITKLGSYSLKVELFKDVIAQVKVNVVSL